MAWISFDLEYEWKEKTDGLTSYEVGDIVECLKTEKYTRSDAGSILLITKVSNDMYATTTLKGTCNKGAWWDAKDFNLIEKNYIYRMNKGKMNGVR